MFHLHFHRNSNGRYCSLIDPAAARSCYCDDILRRISYCLLSTISASLLVGYKTEPSGPLLPFLIHSNYLITAFNITSTFSKHLLQSQITMLRIRTSSYIFAFLALCTLAWNEDRYFPPFLGPILDLFFDRDPYDPFYYGSGYTLFIDDNWETMVNLVKFLINLFWSLLLLVSLPPIITVIHLLRMHNAESQTRLADAIIAMHAAHEAGEENAFKTPPRPSPRPSPRPDLKPTRDTRYMTLGGDGTVIWVCGVGGGFEDVHGGDLEGAIARRWKRMGRKQFA